jgi:hypothetical protein
LESIVAKKVRKMMSNKYAFVVTKHKKALQGTGFECCAPCPGTSGKVTDGHMRCSNAGPRPIYIDVDTANRCEGGKPFPKRGRLTK